MNIFEESGYCPTYVALEITRKCNMRCLHCGSSATENDQANSLSITEWRHVITELQQLGTQCIFLSGGEPLVYPHWQDLVTFIRQISPPDAPIEIGIVTNGWLLNEANIQFLRETAVNRIAISLDGDAATHDYIRQTPGAFRKVIEDLQLCKRYEVPVSLISSINQINFPVRKQLALIAAESGAELWQVQIVNSFGRAGSLKDDMLITHQQYIQLIDDMAEWKTQYQGQMQVCGADSIGYFHPKTDIFLEDCQWQGCNAGLYVLGIESNGNVKGCLSLQDDYFISGNIRNRSIRDIWNDENAFPYTRNYETQNMNGFCKTCNEHSECKAGCLGMAYSIHHSIYENTYCYKQIMEKRTKEPISGD